MNVRLIAARIERGVIHVYPLLCMDCEGDVFEWIDSQQVQDARTEEYFLLGTYACAHCGFVHNLDERTFTIEATDDKDGWLARRHVNRSVRAKKKDPSSGSADERPTPSGEVR